MIVELWKELEHRSIQTIAGDVRLGVLLCSKKKFTCFSLGDCTDLLNNVRPRVFI